MTYEGSIQSVGSNEYDSPLAQCGGDESQVVWGQARYDGHS
jgi:hypothetical protein